MDAGVGMDVGTRVRVNVGMGVSADGRLLSVSVWVSVLVVV